MRRWQPLLESLLHHTLIAGPLCWSFYLGRLEGLSSGVCHFLLSWPWLAKDRVVLGDVSQQFGPSLFVLRRFFFLGVGLGLDMRWAGVARPFGPTIIITTNTTKNFLKSNMKKYNIKHFTVHTMWTENHTFDNAKFVLYFFFFWLLSKGYCNYSLGN